MMKYNVVVFSFYLLLLSLSPNVLANPIMLKDHEKKIKNFYQIKSLADKVGRKDLEEEIRKFVAQTRPSRIVNSPGHLAAQKYIKDELKKLTLPGSSVTEQDFILDVDSAIKDYRDEFQKEIAEKYDVKDPLYQKWFKVTDSMVRLTNKYRGTKGKNLIFEKKGVSRPNDILILGANFDTLVHNPETLIPEPEKAMPGADNNASGVVALLNLAKILNALDLPITVKIVFFDAEELSFLGSKAYLDQYGEELKKQNVMGFINVLMIGHDSKREDKEKKNNNMAMYFRPNNEREMSFAGKIINGGKKTWSAIDFKPVANAMNSSSHQVFWDRGFDAVVMTQNWESDFNPRWHTPNDFVETLNLSTWTSAFKFITGSVLSLSFGVEK